MKENISRILTLSFGITLGAVAATLILRTMPPQQGSPEERIAQLEHDLKKSRSDYQSLADTSPRKRFGHTSKDTIRSITERIKSGQPISPDDIFQSFKPLMRDLSPITERMNSINAKLHAESLAGEYTRKFGLNKQQQDALIEHLTAHQEAEGKALSDILESDHTSFLSYMKTQREFDQESGIDSFMARTLEGENLQTFQNERINEKSQRVQADADLQVQRIDGIVKLDDAQRHQMFLYMAQSSRDYDPQMQFDGLAEGTKNLPAQTKRNDAILSVLRSDQRQVYEDHRHQQIQKSQTEAARLGITLPDEWVIGDDLW